jgi:hypothetical protein
MIVGLLERDVGGDPERRLERDGVGCVPAGRGEAAVEFLLGTDEGDIHRITLVPLLCDRAPRRTGERGMPLDGARRLLSEHPRGGGHEQQYGKRECVRDLSASNTGPGLCQPERSGETLGCFWGEGRRWR